jgi:hypothetical protein
MPKSLAAAALVALALASPALADSPTTTFDVKPGMEITFLASVVDGKVVLGTGHITKLGTAEPKDGEIVVGIAPKVQPFYAELRAREKTAAPIDFVATGLIGGTKIDEIVVCGRTDAPIAHHIANQAWHISLNSFEPGKTYPSCR